MTNKNMIIIPIIIIILFVAIWQILKTDETPPQQTQETQTQDKISTTPTQTPAHGVLIKRAKEQSGQQ